jgi:hypothetical protein
LKFLEELKTENDKRLFPVSHLTQWYDDTRLKIRKEDAHAFIEIGYSKIIKQIDDNSQLTAVQKEEVRGLVTLKRNQQIFAVSQIDAGVYRLSNRGIDERLHSVLTGMKRELRSFLQFEGEDFISLDIKSSQPYLFTVLLKKSFYDKSEEDILGWKSITNSLLNPSETTSDYPPPTTPTPTTPTKDLYPNMFRGFSGFSEDEILSRSAFFNFEWDKNDIYLQLQSELQGLEAGPKTREDAKQLVMWLLFEYKEYKYGNNDFKLFAAKYPIEAGIMRGVGNIKEKLLPITLQRMESRIMLRRVTKTISEVLPTAPLLTVHDSILTTPPYADQVKRIMQQELEQVTGLKPGITVEGKSSGTQLDSLEDFVNSIYNDSLQSILRPKRKRSKGSNKGGKSVRMSFAGYQKESPLLFSIPRYKDMQVFSPFFFNLNDDALYDQLELDAVMSEVSYKNMIP